MAVARSFSQSTVFWMLAVAAAPVVCFFLLTGRCRARYGCDIRKFDALQVRGRELSAEAKDLENYLIRFTRDSEFRKHVVRERLGYADSGEFVYVFEE
ncbi:MAG: septum formation initiator family protein [Puniceicoccales bacterium]|jgi:hypothetical protein|nr:septum formation initiator family protein [Puniceicoccales bacterium]